MCGIFGYVGQKNAKDSIVDGLKRLEYRGYDSWGVAVINNGNISTYKEVGAISGIKNGKLKEFSAVGIGHTRWATHGGVKKKNAHPHMATDGSFALAQNGIVENYQELKSDLISKGYKFVSETDTEVIVRLVEEKAKEVKDLREAVRLASLDLKGRNTILVLESATKRVIGVRNGSPMVVGVGDDEIFIASDTLSFANHTNSVVLIDDFQMIDIIDEELKVFEVKSGKELEYNVVEVDVEDSKIDKGGYDHFMLKEILEQKHTVREAVQYSEKELSDIVQKLKSARRVYTVGAGTAYFAAAQIAYFLRMYVGIDAIELKAYETESYVSGFDKNDLIIAVSQSGETADTIEALEFAKDKNVVIASIVNMVGSTIARMSEYSFLTRSGPEICVASTKAFTAQVAWGYLLAKTAAGEFQGGKDLVLKTCEQMDEMLNEEYLLDVEKIAEKILKKGNAFVLGKGQNFNVALEGALKIKEISYKHFEGFAAGELKHGVIALIEDGTPVFVIVSEDQNKADLMSAAAEVKAREAMVLGVSPEENELFDEILRVPDAGECSPIVNVIPFQLMSYYLGTKMGCDPDKPRNLAKSVTVK